MKSRQVTAAAVQHVFVAIVFAVAADGALGGTATAGAAGNAGAGAGAIAGTGTGAGAGAGVTCAAGAVGGG